MDGGPPGNTWGRRLLPAGELTQVFCRVLHRREERHGTQWTGSRKCQDRMCETIESFICYKKYPSPQPNIEIRKPSIELKFTLISVTICSLIFFICTLEVLDSQGTRSIPGRACGVPMQVYKKCETGLQNCKSLQVLTLAKITSQLPTTIPR